MMKRRYFTGLGVGFCIVLAITAWSVFSQEGWSEEERTVLRDLWMGSLEPLPADLTSAVADNRLAIDLGHKLFFDTRLSGNGQVACATCHMPDRAFTDGLPLAQGVGTTDRKTPTIVGAAYSPWQFWDGRADSLWAQALGPLESGVEHGGSRTLLAHVVARHYRADYEAVFGPLPDLSDLDRFPLHAGPIADQEARQAWDAMAEADRAVITEIFVNIGKAIAAYERQLLPGDSRFDVYVAGVLANDREKYADVLSDDEVAGLRLFIGKANCIECHGSSLLTNNDFHNIGVPPRDADVPDDGRRSGVLKVIDAEFNCLSIHSDAVDGHCDELRFVKSDGHELAGAFKTPTLRMVGAREPYMHAGQFATLDEVIRHYNNAPEAHVGHSELTPLGLSEREIEQLVAFLRSLDGPVDAPAELLRAPLP